MRGISNAKLSLSELKTVIKSSLVLLHDKGNRFKLSNLLSYRSFAIETFPLAHRLLLGRR